ncbi:Thiamine pyrophosphokinase [Bacillus sp. THAF10]|uniref:thiamine diphosphokinase n=1 Tax=Bacillus sp. THAF10 TaxID=2587848 RepID=UPI001267D09B|nr:thiamine diphosphokinase [Bacillus sp. THAF10]QFT88826.1 Thiamine pyrophosphokinase [Bacillus sp. THAF10]
MIIQIVAGGPKENIPDLMSFHGEDVLWIGVDCGVSYLLETGITPKKIYGDFDSVSNEQKETILQRFSDAEIFPSEKNETDTEIAINWALKQKPSLIRIFGGTGGRLDHFLANIQLLLKGLEHGSRIEILDIQNRMHVVKEGTYSLCKDSSFPYTSFLPVSRFVLGITLTGFKYPLTNRNIKWGDTLCISNEMVCENGTFSFHEGILMVIRSRDYHSSF